MSMLPVQHHVNYDIVLRGNQIFNPGIFSIGIFIFGGNLSEGGAQINVWSNKYVDDHPLFHS